MTEKRNTRQKKTEDRERTEKSKKTVNDCLKKTKYFSRRFRRRLIFIIFEEKTKKTKKRLRAFLRKTKKTNIFF